MFHIIGMVIVGLIAGALARLILPGKDPMGIPATILLGIAGSFVGGLIARALLGPKDGEGLLRPSFLFSILGAILLLWVWRMIQRRSASA
jgi:uncharacterized membrane protein YeaQ/YmgE (transglycosylase-associated protein family)